MKRAAAVAMLVGTCVLAGPQVASAHIRILSPTPRSDQDNLKSGPCGAGFDARGANPILARSGSLLRLEWEETIVHRSHYRVSFDAEGQDDFADPPEMQAYYSNKAVLLDAMADEDGMGGIITADIPLPDVECENCTLQLIQVMYDKQPYEVGGNDIYYACVDLTLRRDAPCSDVNVNMDAGSGGVTCEARWPDAGAGAGDAGLDDATGGSGAVGGGYGGGNSGTPAGTGEYASCSVAATPGGGRASLLVLLGLSLLFVRRRR